MTLLGVLLVNWAKAGVIAWAVWAVAAFIRILVETKANPVLIEQLGVNANDGKFRDKPGKDQIRVIARTFIWPWGLFETSRILDQELAKVLK
jgi:hypothetical protein